MISILTHTKDQSPQSVIDELIDQSINKISRIKFGSTPSPQIHLLKGNTHVKTNDNTVESWLAMLTINFTLSAHHKIYILDNETSKAKKSMQSKCNEKNVLIYLVFGDI